MTDDSLYRLVTEFRHELHRYPETAHAEAETAGRVNAFLKRHAPAAIVGGVGGHGLVAVLPGQKPGATVLLRAELDGLPIPDEINEEHVSRRPGIGHKCGHDGHMAALVGVAARFHATPPPAGSLLLVFQPAEETGEGAARVLADSRFGSFRPDLALAWHNLPGYPFGTVILRDGVFAAASRGLIVQLIGATAHAAEPSRGRSPALAMAELITAFCSVPEFATGPAETALATVIHARLGDVAFGTSPGTAIVMVTLRAHDSRTLHRLGDWCLQRGRAIASAHHLETSFEWTQAFPVTVNQPSANALIEQAVAQLDAPVVRRETPFAWSEDFGYFLERTPGALFGLGAGVGTPALHARDYDFPDLLLPLAAPLLERVVRAALGGTPGQNGESDDGRGT